MKKFNFVLRYFTLILSIVGTIFYTLLMLVRIEFDLKDTLDYSDIHIFIAFILTLYLIYCFCRNNIYKSYYSRLIYILSFMIIFIPFVSNKLIINKFVYDPVLIGRSFWEIIFSMYFVVYLSPACLICISTMVNYFTYKKYNEN